MEEETRLVKGKNYLEIIEAAENNDDPKILGTQNEDIKIDNEYQSYAYHTRHKPDHLLIHFKNGTKKGLPVHQMGLSEFTEEEEILLQFQNYVFLFEGENMVVLWEAIANRFVSRIVEFSEKYDGDISPENVKVTSIRVLTLNELKKDVE